MKPYEKLYACKNQCKDVINFKLFLYSCRSEKWSFDDDNVDRHNKYNN